MINLTQTLVDTALFYINAKKSTEILLNKEDWISVDVLTPDVVMDLKNNNYKVAFIKQENIFSHSMNVLRKILIGTETIAVVGVEKIFTLLQNSDICKIDMVENVITLENKEYKFRNFNFLRDTSEIIEYNLDTGEICYKPDYYYNNELSQIIVKGYNLTGTMLPDKHFSRSDNEGRIWDKGFAFPYQFFDYFSDNMHIYFSNLLEYIEVLQKIYLIPKDENVLDELKELLILHYSFSTIFSFITPNISESLKSTIGSDALEKVYGVFVINSPIHDKEKLTDASLKNMKNFLINIKKGFENGENYKLIYNVDNIPVDDMSLMYFITNMFSDIRRCVINLTIEKNSWFSSICKHRKKAKIY